MKKTVISKIQIEQLCNSMSEENKKRGYNFNPDQEFTKSLIESLLVNEDRYGYPACPCRLATGNKIEDLDIICPCDYRDMDLNEFGTCYCGLYVTEEIVDGEKKTLPIEERRPRKAEREKMQNDKKTEERGKLNYPIWRCKVCGYICARDEAPGKCPICGVEKARFERFA